METEKTKLRPLATGARVHANNVEQSAATPHPVFNHAGVAVVAF